MVSLWFDKRFRRNFHNGLYASLSGLAVCTILFAYMKGNQPRDITDNFGLRLWYPLLWNDDGSGLRLNDETDLTFHWRVSV